MARVIDWEGIEKEYRAGIRSLRDIADQFEVTHGAIRKRAARDGWTRSLGAKIKAAAESLVSKDAVSSAVSTVSSEREIIDANAALQAHVIRSHRCDVGRFRMLATKLIDELEVETLGGDDYQKLGDLLSDPNTNNIKLQEAYRRAISLPGRTSTAKQLAETLKILIALEREAFSLGEQPRDSIESIADAIRNARGGN